MELVDSRRLPGANILWARPGAVINVTALESELPVLISGWQRAVRQRLDGLGWGAEQFHVRHSGDGASLAISAPLDALYAATEVNESAWQAACAEHCGEEPSNLNSDLEKLRAVIAEEINEPLITLQQAAEEHSVCFLSDDDQVSIGLGTGSQAWPVEAIPHPDAIEWDAIHDVPTTLITGTNGKTTTARLLAAIATAASRVPGISSTDRVQVGNDILDEGDWSGPGGARLVMRDKRTQIGILETARGGMLRRGLALNRCNVAAVLNVGTDHLGEWGICTLEGLAEGKFVVTHVADQVVLNAEDEVVAARGETLDKPVIWFALDAKHPRVVEHLKRGGRACVLDGEDLILCQGTEQRALLNVANLPVSLGGAAHYNVANALAAAAIADALGFDIEHIRLGLSTFESTVQDNPGRLNRFELGGVQAIVDYAHNPHGFDAILALMTRLPAKRRLVVLGQAGDRDEPSVREMTRLTWQARPDMIVIKELTLHLRGKSLGETPAIIEDELRREGIPDDRFVHSPDELEAVRYALNWAQPGDLLMLFTHDYRDQVTQLLQTMQSTLWTPGQALPALTEPGN